MLFCYDSLSRLRQQPRNLNLKKTQFFFLVMDYKQIYLKSAPPRDAIIITLGST